MPGMDGIALAAEMARTAKPRALLLTSLGQQQICAGMVGDGILACMTKPLRRDHLLLKIALLCGKLPAPLMPAPALPTPKASTSTPSSDPGVLQVLVVEDNAVNQKVILRMLSRLGHQHAVAKDGIEALDMLAAQSFDAILMDCQMPGMDGFDTTRVIRQMPEPFSSIPVIAVTANAMQGDREKCLAAGMNAYISKPLNLLELKNALENLRHAEAPHEAADCGAAAVPVR
jgi:CheY-like chemotaxis protein